MGTRGTFPGVKRLERETDHSPSYRAEFKEYMKLYPTPQYAFMAWCPVKAQGQLYLDLLFYMDPNVGR
jgi:hypothetical protein